MADVDVAIMYGLRNEDARLSGKVTADEGGKTRFGIAQKFHPDLDPTFYTCPVAQALPWAKKIYTEEYASHLGLAQITTQAIANKLFDIGINCGIGQAAKFAQTAASDLGQHVTVDEHLGPASIAAINGVNQGLLMSRLITLLSNFYRTLAIKQNRSANELASWLTRANKPGA
jgi:lysozyme family protein